MISFHFLGPDDMVQCAWCFGKLQGWEQGDHPLTEHARHFSSCPKFGDRKAVNASSLVNIQSSQGKLFFAAIIHANYVGLWAPCILDIDHIHFIQATPELVS